MVPIRFNRKGQQRLLEPPVLMPEHLFGGGGGGGDGHRGMACWIGLPLWSINSNRHRQQHAKSRHNEDKQKCHFSTQGGIDWPHQSLVGQQLHPIGSSGGPVAYCQCQITAQIARRVGIAGMLMPVALRCSTKAQAGSAKLKLIVGGLQGVELLGWV